MKDKDAGPIPDPHHQAQHPIHPDKAAEHLNAGELERHNAEANNITAKEHMVDIGRGHNIAARQKQGKQP